MVREPGFSDAEKKLGRVDSHATSQGNSEVQEGFNRYHSTTPLIPKSPVSITSKGPVKDASGCQQGKSLYVAMISKNIRRIGNSAPFASISKRES